MDQRFKFRTPMKTLQRGVLITCCIKFEKQVTIKAEQALDAGLLGFQAPVRVLPGICSTLTQGGPTGQQAWLSQ